MSTTQIDPAFRRPLRLWPGVLIVALQWLARFGLPLVFPETTMYAVLAGVAGGLLVVLWWLFFSRAPWLERVGAIVLMVVALLAAFPLVHASIAHGMMGLMLPIFAIPVLSLALVAWAVGSRRLAPWPRRASLVAVVVLACGVFAVLRTEGVMGTGESQLHWRWTTSPEERLLARGADEPETRLPAAQALEPREKPQPAPAGEPAATPVPPPAAVSPPATQAHSPGGSEPPAAPAPPAASTGAASVEWPGFRGRDRDGIIRGVRIATDWSASPPAELWRRPIGPGWSSFAVAGTRFYTQEQRGDDEIVSCYSVATGAPVWRHRDAARFWESNAGAGPRATPTLHDGRVYTLGATGIVNALDAADGAVLWTRNAAADTGVEVPTWGFAGSPLVVDDLVVVAAAGTLVAYEADTGAKRWSGPSGAGGYSSPHFATIDGVRQILLVDGNGATSVGIDGARLWTFAWPGDGIVQPALAAGGDVLVGTGSKLGVGKASLGPGGWSVTEGWTSTGLKPYFNDIVVHNGHAFGFDGRILACVDLVAGDRKWKGGRYGHGQLMLLADQDLLLVLSEDGDLALVNATPDRFTEVARVPAIEGKTWNHPALAGDVLLVRNGQEMAAFRVSIVGR